MQASVAATCGGELRCRLPGTGLQIDERKKEIRNLVSLDYWFVSGVYAEILQVEKCFLMYARLFHSSTVADRFLFRYATIQSFERRYRGEKMC